MRTTTMIALALLPWSATAAAGQVAPPAAGAPRTLSVVGEGEVTAPPDLAVLGVAVETEAVQAAEAARRNAEITEKVLQAVRPLLGEGGKATTAGYSLYPHYESPSPGRQGDAPTIRGYRASNEVRVELRDLARVGRVVDAAIAAGANRVANLAFSLEAREPQVRAALAVAGRAARAEAEAAAAALGVRLGPVLAASTGTSGMTPPIPMPHMARMSVQDVAVTTPVEPGDVTVRVVLNVTYGIE
jgi:uncharacterized protein